MKSFLSVICVCVFLRTNSAALTITQGRIINNHGHIEVDVYSVVGIATVELSGDPASRPTYYFDCKTTRNNASGLMWTKMNNQTRFEVQVIPDGSPGKRLNASGIGYHDLDKYVCSDTTSNDVASINITGLNPAIMATKNNVEVLQGSSIKLEVYVSGYPIPTESDITWKRPNLREISDLDDTVDFQDGHRRLTLSNIQPHQSGLYSVTVSLPPNRVARTGVYLNVYSMQSISEIYPLGSDITKENPFVYTVPLNYLGNVLTCNAYGWPTQKIEWWRDGESLSDDSGVISESTAASGSSQDSMSAILTWTRGFMHEDEGIYECVIVNERNNSYLPIASQNVEIKVGNDIYLDTELMTSCNIHTLNEHFIHFQIRVLDTNCLGWTKSQKERIRIEFQNRVINVVSRQCDCEVTTDELLVEHVPHCSILVDRAALFRGLIRTISTAKTEKIFCALYSWQQKSPLLVIDSSLQTVDISCHMRYYYTSDEECAPSQTKDPERDRVREIFEIVGGVTGFTMVVILFITIICCMGYCCSREKRETPGSCDTTVDEDVSTSRVDEPEHVYDHVDFPTLRYGCNGPISSEGDDLAYSLLTLSIDTVVGHPPQAERLSRPFPPAGSRSGHTNILAEGGSGKSDLPYATASTSSHQQQDMLYEHISDLDLQLDKEEAQPYSPSTQ